MEDRDMREIIMDIQKASMLMRPMMQMGGVAGILLLQHLMRMRKEKKITKREFKDFQDFFATVEGKYNIFNIPVENADLKYNGKNAIDFNSLREAGIRFTVLPDLNASDNLIQIAVYDQDKDLFLAWQQRYIQSHMTGGEHLKEGLDAFTNNQTSIISIPFENDQTFFQKDFEKLGINYSVLPDLNVGDGQIQLVIPNADLKKVEYWYKLYQEDCMEKGIEVPNLTKIDAESYQATGIQDDTEYLNNCDEENQAIKDKYNHDPEKSSDKQIQPVMLSENTKEYIEQEKNENLQKFTLDKGTLGVGKEEAKYFEEKGFLVTRVPKTWGNSINYLVVPIDEVFMSKTIKINDKGEEEEHITYTTFLNKNEKVLLLNKDFKPISADFRPNAAEIFKSNYDLSKTEQEITKDSVNNTIRKNIRKEKVVDMPLKVR